MKPELFMLIAGDLAAEQRAIVAHSASYGSDRPQISQAPAGGVRKPRFNTSFLSPHPGLESFVRTSFPQFALWATIIRHSVAEFAAG
jgi:hypothetical protein